MALMRERPHSWAAGCLPSEWPMEKYHTHWHGRGKQASHHGEEENRNDLMTEYICHPHAFKYT